MKDKTTAGVLALFLGGIGVHRFYLGQSGLGLMYLIFCWTLVPAVIALIDGLIFLTSSQESFDFKHNKTAATTPTIIQLNSTPPAKVADELKKLHALKEDGIISDSDFEVQKSRLLG